MREKNPYLDDPHINKKACIVAKKLI